MTIFSALTKWVDIRELVKLSFFISGAELVEEVGGKLVKGHNLYNPCVWHIELPTKP